ncbi:MAG: hypothetical protein JWQ35_2470 [Bacteriovoracaceae bacterium]|nr:hypothetical protein [Bacteriovoracaceae bacterium]
MRPTPLKNLLFSQPKRIYFFLTLAILLIALIVHYGTISDNARALKAAREAYRSEPNSPKAQLNLRNLERKVKVQESFFRAPYDGRADQLPANSFGQAQSFLEELNGEPLLAGNWSGRFRPYVFRKGHYLSLFQERPLKNFENFDFYSPTPISNHEILFAGEELGNKKFDLFLYDTQKAKIVPLTNTPGSDNGDFCLSPKKDLIAFRQDQSERIAKLFDQTLHYFDGSEMPEFQRCLWVNQNKFLGLAGREKPFAIYSCETNNEKALCTQSSLGHSLQDFQDFYKTDDGEIGFIALKDDSEFRQAYAINDGFKSSKLSLKNPKAKGDVLEITDGVSRLGFESRYWSTLSNEKTSIIFKIKKMGSEFFAIAADGNSSKSLAVLDRERWKIQAHPNFSAPSTISEPKEIWLQAANAARTQAFYFGAEHPKKVVVWFHGGPKENVSPRFNPYFQELNRRGFGVLAVNYPGSTGRGREFQESFKNSGAQSQSMKSVFKFLSDNSADEIIAWSISTGAEMQKFILKNGFRVSAVVDQAGQNSTELRELALDRHIPYFSIRGTNDYFPDDTGFFDVLYEGGHDISFFPNFRILFEKFDAFLARLENH